MKKRTRPKGASLPKALRQQSTSYSAPTIIRRARDYPLYESWISASWQKEEPGLVELIVARQQPDGMICFGVYLIDKLCLGLKNTFARANVAPARYQQEVQRMFHERAVTCSSELAHQMIYASIDYARRYGFEPHKDFDLSQFILAPRGTFNESYNLKFGKDGKPLFISGPHDNAAEILKQLDKTAGPGNYHYVVGVPEMF